MTARDSSSGRRGLLDPDATEPVPWRNAAGRTRELVDDPDGWRLSVADLVADAPFSHFPGVDRTFLPLVDVDLVIDGVRTSVDAGSVAVFPGESTVGLELVAGPGRAVNLMTTRGRCRGGLTLLSDPARADPSRRLVVDLGDVAVEVEVELDDETLPPRPAATDRAT